jgi:hypothetical protein
MSTPETQKGWLQRLDLGKPSTLPDNRRVEVQYAIANDLWAPSHSFRLSVRAMDGQSIDPGKYSFFALEEGWFKRDTGSLLTQYEDGQWQR